MKDADSGLLATCVLSAFRFIRRESLGLTAFTPDIAAAYG
jgi:hypothetical protein